MSSYPLSLAILRLPYRITAEDVDAVNKVLMARYARHLDDRAKCVRKYLGNAESPRVETTAAGAVAREPALSLACPDCGAPMALTENGGCYCRDCWAHAAKEEP